MTGDGLNIVIRSLKETGRVDIDGCGTSDSRGCLRGRRAEARSSKVKRVVAWRNSEESVGARLIRNCRPGD